MMGNQDSGVTTFSLWNNALQRVTTVNDAPVAPHTTLSNKNATGLSSGMMHPFLSGGQQMQAQGAASTTSFELPEATFDDDDLDDIYMDVVE